MGSINGNNESVASKDTFLGWVLPGMHLIKLDPEFFQYQYLCKESVDILDFLKGDNYQEKVASDPAAFGWMWSRVPPVQSDWRIL